MNLILLYGPPAVGKLTVAKKLGKLTGYKLFDNHSVIDVVSKIFDWGNPALLKLEYEIRARVVQEAARSGINLIVTGAIVNHNEFLYKGFVDSYSMRDGRALLVKLTADKQTLNGRVEHESRQRKINTKDFLGEFIGKYPETLDKFGEGEQLVIDTSETAPKEAAQRIVDFYKL
ncbi:MAG: hypothetical protein A2868_02440 [Candidatus Levybacteria bacterium RIFCSPHIGHO2_01_FULL_40_15b]|nr:MAG: hypothetical protein A2868_02440 [Candidatus Levybacteria bacterium RIFCSPHIGHO2_01_FULL_40_15b]